MIHGGRLREKEQVRRGVQRDGERVRERKKDRVVEKEGVCDITRWGRGGQKRRERRNEEKQKRRIDDEGDGVGRETRRERQKKAERHRVRQWWW